MSPWLEKVSGFEKSEERCCYFRRYRSDDNFWASTPAVLKSKALLSVGVGCEEPMVAGV